MLEQTWRCQIVDVLRKRPRTAEGEIDNPPIPFDKLHASYPPMKASSPRSQSQKSKQAPPPEKKPAKPAKPDRPEEAPSPPLTEAALWESLAQIAAGNDDPLGRALAVLGPFYQADRAWAGRYNDALTHFWGNSEWLGPGITSHLHEIQGVPVDLIGEAHRKFIRHEPVIIPDVERMPRQLRGLQAELRRESVRSTVAFPLVREGKLTGFYGFDHVRELATWSKADIDRLPALGSYLARLLHRHLYLALPADLPPPPQRSIFVSEHSGMKALSSDAVLFIRADGDYSRVHLTDGGSYFERRSLKNWIGQLPRERFLRVHQSYLINGARIERLDRGPRWTLRLQGHPEEIPVGRAFRHAIRLHMAF